MSDLPHISEEILKNFDKDIESIMEFQESEFVTKESVKDYIKMCFRSAYFKGKSVGTSDTIKTWNSCNEEKERSSSKLSFFNKKKS